MKDPFSVRTGWDTTESSFAGLARKATAEAGIPWIDLTISNPTLCGFHYPTNQILAPLTNFGSLIYQPDPRGLRAAREAVAQYYVDHGVSVDPETVVLTTSTSEAYGFLFRLLCNAGDEVLVAQPSYPLFEFLADLEDVHLCHYPLFYDFGWWIDFAELERKISSRTKAILVVHPNNPTGHWTVDEEKNRLIALCAKHGIALIVDEVFLDYPLQPLQAPITFAAEKENILMFVLSGMSKIAGLPQMKISWVITRGPTALKEEALARLEMIADTFLSMSMPTQLALPNWLGARFEIQEQIQLRTRTNLLAVKNAGIQVLQTDAGWNSILRTQISSEEFMASQGVLTHPGSFYGISERNRLVVSLLSSEEEFANGMKRLAQINSYQ